MYVFFYNRVFKKAPRIYCQKFARIELNIYHFKAVWPIDGFFFLNSTAWATKIIHYKQKESLWKTTVLRLGLLLFLCYCFSAFHTCSCSLHLGRLAR